MAYKDADKRKEAERERQRRYRASKKGVTKPVTPLEDVTPEVVTPSVTPKLYPNSRGWDLHAEVVGVRCVFKE